MSAVAFDTPRQATRVDDIGGRFDPWLLGVSIMLACTGVVMVGSAAVAGAACAERAAACHSRPCGTR